MSSSGLKIFLDDTNNAFNFEAGSQNWAVSHDTRRAGGTQTSFTTGPSGSKGEFSITFTGTAISFIGDTPPPNASQKILVTIDDHEPYETSYADPSPPSYRQWYQSPVLGVGRHTVRVQGIDTGASVDYAVTTADKSDQVFGNSIIVNDDDPDIKYGGTWIEDSGVLSGDSSGNLHGLPYQNGTHQSSMPGSTAQVHFSGSTIAAFGALQLTGSITVLFQVDDLPAEIKTFSANATSSTLSPPPQFNYEWYSNQDLTPNLHTLFINVTESNNQPFSLDYIRYNAVFTGLRSKPSGPWPGIKSPQTGTPQLGTPILVGIVLGALAAIILIGAIVYFMMCPRPSPRSKPRFRIGRVRTRSNLDLELQDIPADIPVLHIRHHYNPNQNYVSPSCQPSLHQNPITVKTPSPSSPSTITPFHVNVNTTPSPSTVQLQRAVDIKKRTILLNDLLREQEQAGQAPSQEHMTAITELCQIIRQLVEQNAQLANLHSPSPSHDRPPSYRESWNPGVS